MEKPMSNTDKRKNDRIASLNLSYVSVDDAGRTIQEGMGRTLNVSESGILLETAFEAEPGQSVSLTIAVGDDLIDLKGEIIRCRKTAENEYQTGVRFLELDRDARDIVRIIRRQLDASNAGADLARSDEPDE